MTTALFCDKPDWRTHKLTNNFIESPISCTIITNFTTTYTGRNRDERKTFESTNNISFLSYNDPAAHFSPALYATQINIPRH
jgi:hypothetical protein